MSFDSERLVPEAAPEASLQEHLARYRFARDRVRGRVLDLACGTGYGTRLLGACGADSSMEALRHARTRYPATYAAADALRLPFRSGSLDAVVSFETIEHVADPVLMVAEVRRVLRPGGLFLVSTPNRDLWSPHSARPCQRHHLKEFNPKEFRSLFGSFARVEWFGQLMLSRPRAILFEGKELGKRVIRALTPIHRFRRWCRVNLEDLAPDPAYAVLPWGRGLTPAILVAHATR